MKKTGTTRSKKHVGRTDLQPSVPAAKLIDLRIRELGDWRGETLSRVRSIIRRAVPEVVEEWKWDVPVWSHAGILCTGESYKQVVKLTFPKGASLPDPAGLFNSSLRGSTRRAIDLREAEPINEKALATLIRAAAAFNAESRRDKPVAKSPRRSPPVSTTAASTRASRTRGTSRSAHAPAQSPSAQPVLLAGGNPQIPKGVGDAPVQAYITAMPGWKREIGRRVDAIVTSAVPGVRKAVKWNSPLYGLDGQSWFLSFHCFMKYVKVAFFRGAMLSPPPPGASKQKDVRYLDIREEDLPRLDEAQIAEWARQASRLPGERM